MRLTHPLIPETVESNSEASLSRETTTETPASDQTSESEEIIADQTTEEIASNEAFDVDTIFTSGTFEIAAGGGNPDDSIFQGEVELAQMKMTRDNGTWSPSSGKHLEASALTSTALISVAPLMPPTTERALQSLNPVLTLPEIGSSNNIDWEEEPSADSTEEES